MLWLSWVVHFCWHFLLIYIYKKQKNFVKSILNGNSFRKPFCDSDFITSGFLQKCADKKNCIKKNKTKQSLLKYDHAKMKTFITTFFRSFNLQSVSGDYWCWKATSSHFELKSKTLLHNHEWDIYIITLLNALFWVKVFSTFLLHESIESRLVHFFPLQGTF